MPIQVQGGNTGLVGGSVPDRPALLLATTALVGLEPVDLVERTVRVGAGVTAARVAGHARAAGLRFGVDLAARDSATVGGMVATNAGGMGVVAHGMMREQVRGLVAVLADGRVLRTVGRPRKDNCGYDLGHLLVGSEGTLGVITEVELVLHPAPAAPSVALLAAGSLAQAVGWARRVQAAGWPLLAAEVVDAAGVTRASAALGQPDPLPDGADWLLLLEVADGATGAGLEPVGDHVVALATEPADRARLWAPREQQTELYARLAGLGPQKLDVSFRLDALDAGVGAIRATVAQFAVAAPVTDAHAEDETGYRADDPADDHGDDSAADRGDARADHVTDDRGDARADHLAGDRGDAGADARAHNLAGADGDARADHLAGDGADDRAGARAGARADHLAGDHADARARDSAESGWVGFFGHALDGNLHVQLVDVPEGTAQRVLAQVAALGGSISAEHGIGRMKAGQLHLSRSGAGDRVDAPDPRRGGPIRPAQSGRPVR